MNQKSYCKGHPNYIEFFYLFTDVCFTWYKGHNNILGNAIADFFAKDSVTNVTKVHDARTASTNFPFKKKTFKTKSIEFWLERWSNTENAE